MQSESPGPAEAPIAVEEPYRQRIKRAFRTKRMRRFVELFRPTAQTRIIDVGGTPFSWRLIDVKPLITMVNIGGETGTFGHITMLHGDATALAFPDNSFDLAYSNSALSMSAGGTRLRPMPVRSGALPRPTTFRRRTSGSRSSRIASDSCCIGFRCRSGGGSIAGSA
jgi:Methyltransferase domain